MLSSSSSSLHMKFLSHLIGHMVQSYNYSNCCVRGSFEESRGLNISSLGHKIIKVTTKLHSWWKAKRTRFSILKAAIPEQVQKRNQRKCCEFHLTRRRTETRNILVKRATNWIKEMKKERERRRSCWERMCRWFRCCCWWCWVITAHNEIFSEARKSI